MQSRKFPSLEEAEKYLRDLGELKFFGWEGTTIEGSYAVYTFIHKDGRSFGLGIYPDGKVVVMR